MLVLVDGTTRGKIWVDKTPHSVYFVSLDRSHIHLKCSSTNSTWQHTKDDGRKRKALMQEDDTNDTIMSLHWNTMESKFQFFFNFSCFLTSNPHINLFSYVLRIKFIWIFIHFILFPNKKCKHGKFHIKRVGKLCYMKNYFSSISISFHRIFVIPAVPTANFLNMNIFPLKLDTLHEIHLIHEFMFEWVDEKWWWWWWDDGGRKCKMTSNFKF